MVRLCLFLLLLRKEQDGIHMPYGLMDDLEGEVADEKLHECALGHDIFYSMRFYYFSDRLGTYCISTG